MLEDDDKVDYCTVLMISSKKTEVTHLFPIIKLLDEDRNISLLKIVKMIQKISFPNRYENYTFENVQSKATLPSISILVFIPFLSEASKTPEFRVPNPSI